jgi:5-methylcytosine-specific restriction endonuclease McrA
MEVVFMSNNTENRSPESLARRKIYKRIAVSKKRLNLEFKEKEKLQRVVKMATQEEKERRAAYRKKYRSSELGRKKEMEYKHSERGMRVRLNSHYKRRYGINIDFVNEMLKNQRGLCALCGRDFYETKFYTPYVIDHNHDTGKIRGLVHQRCNTLIGMADEDKNILWQAIRYLGG